MTLHELIGLWKNQNLREDLGEEWSYHDVENGFLIHYKDWLGGIQVMIMPDRWDLTNDETVEVLRITNNQTRQIYREDLREEKDVELEQLHFGVNQRLKYIFGY